MNAFYQRSSVALAIRSVGPRSGPEPGGRATRPDPRRRARARTLAVIEPHEPDPAVPPSSGGPGRVPPSRPAGRHRPARGRVRHRELHKRHAGGPAPGPEFVSEIYATPRPSTPPSPQPRRPLRLLDAAHHERGDGQPSGRLLPARPRADPGEPGRTTQHIPRQRLVPRPGPCPRSRSWWSTAASSRPSSTRCRPRPSSRSKKGRVLRHATLLDRRWPGSSKVGSWQSNTASNPHDLKVMLERMGIVQTGRGCLGATTSPAGPFRRRRRGPPLRGPPAAGLPAGRPAPWPAATVNAATARADTARGRAPFARCIVLRPHTRRPQPDHDGTAIPAPATAAGAPVANPAQETERDEGEGAAPRRAGAPGAPPPCSVASHVAPGHRQRGTDHRGQGERPPAAGTAPRARGTARPRRRWDTAGTAGGGRGRWRPGPGTWPSARNRRGCRRVRADHHRHQHEQPPVSASTSG